MKRDQRKVLFKTLKTDSLLLPKPSPFLTHLHNLTQINWLVEFVGVSIVSTRKKRQQNKKIFSQISDSDTDFVIGRKNLEIQTESRMGRVEESVTSNNSDDSNPVDCSQIVFSILERSFANRVRSEVDSVMTTVETTVQDANF